MKLFGLDDDLFWVIAKSVQQEKQMGGLLGGPCYDFARECAERYVTAKFGGVVAAHAAPPTAKMPAQEPPNDLTDNEKAALWHLAQAWNAFYSLPVLHESDRDDFIRAIHAAQNIIYTRLALRVLGVWFGEDA